MPYVDRFSQNFLLARWSVLYLLMYTWHTLLHYLHGANAGCDLAGVALVDKTLCHTHIAPADEFTRVDKWPWYRGYPAKRALSAMLRALMAGYHRYIKRPLYLYAVLTPFHLWIVNNGCWEFSSGSMVSGICLDISDTPHRTQMGLQKLHWLIVNLMKVPGKFVESCP